MVDRTEGEIEVRENYLDNLNAASLIELCTREMIPGTTPFTKWVGF